MYALVQTGVGVVEAHRVPYCARRSSTCRAKKKTIVEIRFRVSQPKSLQAVRDTRKLQPHYRIWSSFGIPKGSVDYDSGDLSTRVSIAARAQVPGDVSLVTETVREEESIRNSGFVDAAEVEDEDGVVTVGYGWKVREAKFDTEELRAVAHVQASSFHLQTAVFDELFFKLFKAEILSALIYKARHSPSDRYACLLAEPAILMDEGESGDEPVPAVVGAVNLAASVDNDVLRHLHSASEYLYVSGMAVDINFRRKNVATLLLRACELLAMKWGFDYLVLHAYEDDSAARTLYARGGYRVIALDPMWMSTWVGRKRRVLMAKRTSRTPNFDF